ncbi:hypothetical protein Cni_G28304 [Canna indica]|uniref:Uncharacterized protein n=1 Tax=Canna indica TaxID=4628 RepID=A0AAQ3QNP4_9LILI|nr:hypothetical protein Cni_G28304 [Canna indica]
MDQQSYYSRLGRKQRRPRSNAKGGGRGFRLSSQRFILALPLLRVRLCAFLSQLRRCLRVAKRGFRRSTSTGDGSRWQTGRSGSRRGLVSESKMAAFRRSNSFYAEAIADCLEFIKRSASVSVDEVSAVSSRQAS